MKLRLEQAKSRLRTHRRTDGRESTEPKEDVDNKMTVQNGLCESETVVCFRFKWELKRCFELHGYCSWCPCNRLRFLKRELKVFFT